MAHLCISNRIIDIFDRKEKTPVLVSRIVLAGGIFQIIIQYNCILFLTCQMLIILIEDNKSYLI